MINTLGSTTMTLTFEEPDFLTPRQRGRPQAEGIVSIMKNTVDQLEGYRLTHTHTPTDREPYLSHFLDIHANLTLSQRRGRSGDSQ